VVLYGEVIGCSVTEQETGYRVVEFDFAGMPEATGDAVTRLAYLAQRRHWPKAMCRRPDRSPPATHRNEGPSCVPPAPLPDRVAGDTGAASERCRSAKAAERAPTASIIGSHRASGQSAQRSPQLPALSEIGEPK